MFSSVWCVLCFSSLCTHKLIVYIIATRESSIRLPPMPECVFFISFWIIIIVIFVCRWHRFLNNLESGAHQGIIITSNKLCLYPQLVENTHTPMQIYRVCFVLKNIYIYIDMASICSLKSTKTHKLGDLMPGTTTILSNFKNIKLIWTIM